MRKIVPMLALLLFFGATVNAQTVAVQGKVSDVSGPVANATIQEKGTKNIVKADANGVFNIRVKQGATLTISAIGHDNTEVTASSTYMNVDLKARADELQEVMVTTAFNVKKSQRTTPFSSQVIKSDQLNVIRQPNLNNALAGKVAGVQFRGQSAAKLNDQGFLRIRGGGSLNDVAPIYVVDGTLTNSIDINPDDVEDVTVLKGANATALFGSRAVNGAIVVTTRKGGSKKGIGIEVNQGLMFDRAAFLPNYQNEYGGGDGDWLTFNYVAGMPTEWQGLSGKKYRDFTDDASWGPKIDGSEYIPWYAFIPGHSRTGQTAPFVAQPNNVRDFWNTGITNNTNVSFTQSNGAGQNLRVSYTNQSIRGLLPNTKSIRHNLFAAFNMDLGKLFTLNANLTYTNQRINGDFNDGYSNNASGNFSQWFHRDLDINILRDFSNFKTPIGTIASWNFRRNPGAWNAAAPRNSVYGANYWYNPYTYFEQINNVQNRDRIYGDIGLTYKINNHLKVRGTIRTDQFNGNVENVTPNILEFTGVQTGLLARYETSNSVNREWNFEGVVNYNNSFGDFVVSVNAGANRLSIRNRQVLANTNNGLNVPELYAISNSKTTPNITNTRSDQQANSLFAFGDVEYKKYLSLTWAVRNDWFSTLPANDNSLLSPSVGTSFVFSDFTKNALPWLSFGKVFGSWGRKPVALNPYELNLNYSVNQLLWGSNFLMTTPNVAPDANLKGSLVTTWEAGLDLRFAKNKIGLTLTYFFEDNIKAPLQVTSSGVSGFTAQRINAAWIQRQGIETELTARIISKKDFQWRANGTFSYLIDNPVKELAPGLSSILVPTNANNQPGGGAFGTRFARAFQIAGQQWGMLRGGGIKRNDAGQPLITTNGFSGGLGWYSAGDANKEWGSVVPRITGGIQNFLTYKRFNMAVSIDYQFGGKFFSLSEQWGNFSGLFSNTAGLNDKGNPIRNSVASGGGVRVTGVLASDGRTPYDSYVEAYDYFHQFYFQQVAEPFVHSLSAIKMREVSIGYNIPVEKMGKFGKAFQGASISLIARNPFILYRDAKNFDPTEISGVFGEDGQMPGTRSIGFNLKMTF
ncbi:MAG: SusC/RagA family TonB-linked outer membrane protein [Chitinophagaceae bacterium]|nr:SusC/RagA family TonB-linked outer membrane protein [Chitinophagaceae bacterium]MCA6513086.1 SusC/RagA family TonB-linked outer membrane protein [Chitinophagaceae bacterium]